MEPGSNTAMYLILLGNMLPTIGLGIWGFVKWMGARTVKQADDAQAEAKESIKALDKRVTELERGNSDVRAEMRTLVASVEALRGTVVEVRSTVDSRIEKQAENHRAAMKEASQALDERLEKLEFALRQDLTRAVADSMGKRRR